MADKNRNNSNNLQAPNDIKEPKLQRGPFKKKRAGIVLTKDEVKQIKEGRKKLRKDMRAMGIKSKKEFELTASSMMLYFDKNKKGALFWWNLFGKGGLVLLAAGLLFLGAVYLISWITEFRGHFTVNLTDDLFREGFTICENVEFDNPTSHLYSTPAEGVPCISINAIPVDVDSGEGSFRGDYFAYTFYIRNEGENASSYDWQLIKTSETQNLSDAAWVMVFEDEEMTFYAEPRADGSPEALPGFDDSHHGYVEAPLYSRAKSPDDQYEVVKSVGNMTYWRIIPRNFVSDTVVAEGTMYDVLPQEVHKYTVVIWLEGDDPDCTNDLIGGNLGLALQFTAFDEDTVED